MEEVVNKIEIASIEEVKELLASPKKIAITSHRNPDGDAIGSSLALYHYLKLNGHDATVLFPSEYPDFVSWLSGAEDILIYDLQGIKVDKVLLEADIIFSLDYNALHRIDAMGDFINRNCTDTFKILIDHHLDPEEFANYTLSEIKASSTCELIYDFIDSLGDLAQVNEDIGTALLVGILTDTGSFKYNTTVKCYQIAGWLKEKGINDYWIQDRLFNSMTEKQLRLLSYCLSHDSMEIMDEFNTGIIVLSKQDYEHFDIQRGDTEGIVNYILKIRNMRFAALITEQPKIVKLSLRSKGDFSVQEIASRYFRGGGHKNASGGISNLSLQGTIDKFKAILPLYKSLLTKEGHMEEV